MSFWNNPENNSIKVILLVVLLAGVGYFVYHDINKGNKGQVYNPSQAQTVATTTTAAQNAVPSGGLMFSETTSGKTCSVTVTNYANQKESITVAGTLAADGDCKPNVTQASSAAKAMAAAMGSMSVQTAVAATSKPGLMFSETTSGNTCSLTVTNAANAKESITVSGTLAADGDCTPNVTQASSAAQEMASAMGAK